jgi:hypothetical protein
MLDGLQESQTTFENVRPICSTAVELTEQWTAGKFSSQAARNYSATVIVEAQLLTPQIQPLAKAIH